MDLTLYTEQIERLPKTGRHINAQLSGDNIVVYQAYRRSIAEFAVVNQHFGGDFSFNRMSWIKTSFMWMMYRSGWATKEGQEHVLRITIPTDLFDEILKNAVITSFSTEFFNDRDAWNVALRKSEIRLQWDPDHSATGIPLARKAIQLGLKGSLLRRYSDNVVAIEDITGFVHQQHGKINEDLLIPNETLYMPKAKNIIDKIKLDIL